MTERSEVQRAQSQYTTKWRCGHWRTGTVCQ